MRPWMPFFVAALTFAGAAQSAVWLPAEGPGQVAIRALDFRTAFDGLAVGEGNEVLRTLDGGMTWTELNGGFISDGWYDVEVLGASEAWTVGRNAIFQPMAAHSTDGGATWTYATFYIDTGGALAEGVARGVAVSGGAVLVAATTWEAQGALLSSTDGGLTFPTRLLVADPLAAIDAEGATVLAAGAHGAMLRSADGGTSWTRVATGTVEDLFAVRLLDATHAIAVGNEGAVVRSADAGATWDALQVPTGPWLRGVAFATLDTGYAVGLDGAAFKTTDGGATWLPDIVVTRADLFAVAAAQDGMLIRGAIAGQGTLLAGLDVDL